MQQQTPEWFEARLGLVTASRIADVMANSTTNAHQNYMAELVMERLTGSPKQNFCSRAMEWGNETEPRARATYSIATGRDVVEVGFVRHPELEAGASPDGLVGDDGLLEIKCPETYTHFQALIGTEIKKAHIYQMQWQMACTGRKWCDYVSFDPRVPQLELQMNVTRVCRDDDAIGVITSKVSEFISNVISMSDRLLALTEQEAA